MTSKETTLILVLALYILLSSTLGAYYLAITDPRNKGHDITLLDVVGYILPSIVLLIPMLVSYLLDKIIVKKK